jgi:hypothetical protein
MKPPKPGSLRPLRLELRRLRFFLAIALFGCSTTTEPDRVQVLGAIAGYNFDDPRIEIVPARIEDEDRG